MKRWMSVVGMIALMCLVGCKSGSFANIKQKRIAIISLSFGKEATLVRPGQSSISQSLVDLGAAVVEKGLKTTQNPVQKTFYKDFESDILNTFRKYELKVVDKKSYQHNPSFNDLYIQDDYSPKKKNGEERSTVYIPDGYLNIESEFQFGMYDTPDLFKTIPVDAFALVNVMFKKVKKGNVMHLQGDLSIKLIGKSGKVIFSTIIAASSEENLVTHSVQNVSTYTLNEAHFNALRHALIAKLDARIQASLAGR